MKKLVFSFLLLCAATGWAQDRMTPELLWSLKRVSANGISADGQQVMYTTRQYDWKTEKSTTNSYIINIDGSGKAETWVPPAKKSVFQRNGKTWYATQENTIHRSDNEGRTWTTFYEGIEGADNIRVSPDGRYVAYTKEVMVKPTMGKDIYPDLPNTTAQIYTDLNYRHWDTWEDGKYSHVFVAPVNGTPKDIMPGEMHDSPQKPFGGDEDFIWSLDSKVMIDLFLDENRFDGVVTNTPSVVAHWHYTSALKIKAGKK